MGFLSFLSLSGNVGLFHSLSSVLFFRMITVKSNSLKKMLKKLKQKPNQRDLQLKRYVCNYSACSQSYLLSVTTLVLH